VKRTNPVDGVAEITLAGPDRNRLDTGAIRELAEHLRAVADDDAIRALVLSGAAGDFCAGRRPTHGLDTKSEFRADIAPVIEVASLLSDLPAVVITAVEGAALGFGFGLVVQSDVGVLAADAELAFPELARDIPPLLVLSYLPRHLPYKAALDLVLTARTVAPEEAVRLALATEVVEPGGAVERARERARAIAAVDPAAVRLVRGFARRVAAVADGRATTSGADQIAELLASRRRTADVAATDGEEA
jgi:2-(1,2-epoxy-1,2-dihydrophenyl)acetyl-CoA isomerase